ncbi:hypothetical protein HUN39_13190 [Methylocystis sp. FS]|uniref:hypothetical protein n=1 Tax=Methylocystis silviterrae TaxID=2743612 RepID=UPI00158366A3|nr:hypothetical protein [Methylocystis silviterrae]NUJ80970.1 hypothetical protein [Methylocystis silviterrae]
MSDDTDSVDRPALKPSEIEVTPEMIKAGMEEYASRWRGLRDADDAVAEEMLAAAYKSMVLASHQLR